MLSRLRPSPAMGVALIALAVALGGSAYAVSSIDGRSLVNRSVPAVKVKRNALGGTEINEARLGRVPRAASALRADTATSAASATTASVASSAGNAERLGGLGPAAFVHGDARILQGTLAVAAAATGQTLLTVPGVGTLLANCPAGGSVDFRNDSGGTLNLVGTGHNGTAASLLPNAPDLAVGATVTLVSSRSFGISTVSVWSTDRPITVTLTVANTICRFSAQAVSTP